MQHRYQKQIACALLIIIGLLCSLCSCIKQWDAESADIAREGFREVFEESLQLDYSRGMFKINVQSHLLVRGEKIGSVSLKRCLTPLHSYPIRESVERALNDEFKVNDSRIIQSVHMILLILSLKSETEQRHFVAEETGQQADFRFLQNYLQLESFSEASAIFWDDKQLHALQKRLYTFDRQGAEARKQQESELLTLVENLIQTLTTRESIRLSRTDFSQAEIFKAIALLQQNTLFLSYNSASPLFSKELPVLPVIIPYLEFIRRLLQIFIYTIKMFFRISC